MERLGESYHILALRSHRSGFDHGPGALECTNCNMVFGDLSLLQKHKERFCVGSQFGDPNALRLNRGPRDTGRPPDLNLPDEDEKTPRYDPTRDIKVQQLAELHGKQMEFFRNQNKELEEQREEIRRQLEALGKRQPMKDNISEELLRELREEEERSRKMLEELRRQLLEARRPINVITTEKSEPAETPRRHVYPMLFGGSLVEEILAVKQAYIQNGGNDPDILSQLELLLKEAREIEERLKNMPKKQPKEKQDDSQLISVEMENKRLLEQLIQLQEQKMMNKRRPKESSRDDDLERELRRLRRDHLRKMYDVQVQIERMRQESYMDRMMLELHLQNQARSAPAGPSQPTRLILKQKHPPQAPAAPAAGPTVITTGTDPGPGPGPGPIPPATQATETFELTVPYDDDSSPRRFHTYGHTWVHTQHREDVEEDPNYDLGI